MAKPCLAYPANSVYVVICCTVLSIRRHMLALVTLQHPRDLFSFIMKGMLCGVLQGIRHMDRMLNIASVAPTNAGKHVVSNIACACNLQNTRYYVFWLTLMMLYVWCYEMSCLLSEIFWHCLTNRLSKVCHLSMFFCKHFHWLLSFIIKWIFGVLQGIFQHMCVLVWLPYPLPLCWTIWNDVCSVKKREIMLRHNAQHHLGQSEEWIFCVILGYVHTKWLT